MAMEGLSAADIRTGIRDRLAASATITAVVAADHIFLGRTAPIPETDLGAAICIYLSSESQTWAHGASQAMPVKQVDSQISIELTTYGASDEALELALDFIDTIVDVLFSDPTWTQLWAQIPSSRLERVASGEGRRRLGGARADITVTHFRAWS